MAVAVALWSIELQPGTPETFTLPHDLRITNVALGAEVKEGRTSVKLTYKAPMPEEDEEDEEDEEEDEEETTTTVLCSLTPGKIEHALIDLILEQEYEVTFEAVGKNTVHLTGNFVDQTPPHNHGEDYSDMSDEDEDGLDELIADIGSDSDELGGEDDSHRFEEVIEEVEEETEEEPKKKEHSSQKQDSKKRPRESDTMEVDGEETKLSKAQRKKLNKKLKAESGEAVPSGEVKESDKQTEKEQKEAQAKGKKEDKKEKPAFEELAGGVKIQDHKVGTGRQAKAGDHVQMRYVGKLQNGKVFDKNTSGKPFKFHLNRNEVIKGWDIGVAGMQVGGERLLVIPPAMGYGKQRLPEIPPNSTLTFEVKLVGIN